jgi:hypothetical protein
MGGRQDFDCDRAIEPNLVREIDNAHPAATQFSLEGVAACESSLEREEESIRFCGHGQTLRHGAVILASESLAAGAWTVTFATARDGLISKSV